MQALSIVHPDDQQQVFKTKAVLIHENAMSIACDLRNKYLELFEILLAVEAEQIYLEFEVPSMYLYCVDLLELSPQISKDFIVVVRKSLEVPHLAAAIRRKIITIPKARKICPVLTQTDYKEWIELAANCPTRVIEKAVAQANPKEAVFETLTYASECRLEFKLGVSEEWVSALTRTKDLLSQKFGRAVSSEEALFVLMRDHCQKNDPVAKADRSAERASRIATKHTAEPSADGDTSLDRSTQRRRKRYIKAVTQHAVNIRDQGQCTYIDSKGSRCESKRWLQKHHLIHFAEGGSHAAENLKTLCSAHHRITHLKLRRSEI